MCQYTHSQPHRSGSLGKGFATMTLFNPYVHNLVTKRKSPWVGLKPQISPTKCGHCNHYATMHASVQYVCPKAPWCNGYSVCIQYTGDVWDSILTQTDFLYVTKLCTQGLKNIWWQLSYPRCSCELVY